MGMKNVDYNFSQHDTTEFRASKLHYQDAVLFLQRQCDGLLSRGQACMWAYEISRIFPSSRLAGTYQNPIIPLNRKKARKLALKREAEQRANSYQPELPLVFSFKK